MEKKLHETKLNTSHGSIYGAGWCEVVFFEGKGTIYHDHEGYRLSRWMRLKWRLWVWKVKLSRRIFKLKTKICFAIKKLLGLIGGGGYSG